VVKGEVCNPPMAGDSALRVEEVVTISST